jgi:hypothetical protein
LLSTQTGTTYADALSVVLRRTEPAHHGHALGRHAHRVELLHDQLELVDQARIDGDVLRPGRPLIFRQELADLEVVGELELLVGGRNLDEAGGRRVGVARIARVLADEVAVQPAAPLPVARHLHGQAPAFQQRARFALTDAQSVDAWPERRRSDDSATTGLQAAGQRCVILCGHGTEHRQPAVAQAGKRLAAPFLEWQVQRRAWQPDGRAQRTAQPARALAQRNLELALGRDRRDWRRGVGERERSRAEQGAGNQQYEQARQANLHRMLRCAIQRTISCLSWVWPI